MIRNLWYAVLESRQLKQKALGVTRLGERLVFWRDSSKTVHCFFDRCAHRGASLALGGIVTAGHVGHGTECTQGERLQCPFHGFEYDGTGRCVKIPANGKNAPVPAQFKVLSYPVHEQYGIIWIWWGEHPPKDLNPPQFFDDLKDMHYWDTVIDPWNNHYTKVLENQLDVVHIPFVHYNTIGRGNKTLVDGPALEWKGDTMFYHYAYNKHDDGSKPRTPKEIPLPDPNRISKLECILPNMWQNYIFKDMRILGLFVPVDETHTLLYLRFYQNFIKVPVLRTLLMKVFSLYDLKVAHQDRRIVNTQIPKRDGTGTGEHLIQGDYPIMEFRKKRQELKQRNKS